jgi:hypothetical protein
VVPPARSLSVSDRRGHAIALAAVTALSAKESCGSQTSGRQEPEARASGARSRDDCFDLRARRRRAIALATSRSRRLSRRGTSRLIAFASAGVAGRAIAMPRLQLSCRGWRTTASTRRCTSGVGGPGGNRRAIASLRHRAVPRSPERSSGLDRPGDRNARRAMAGVVEPLATPLPRLQLSCRGWRTTASTRRCTSGVGGPGGNRRATASLRHRPVPRSPERSSGLDRPGDRNAQRAMAGVVEPLATPLPRPRSRRPRHRGDRFDARGRRRRGIGMPDVQAKNTQCLL